MGFAVLVDLTKCIGCKACAIACKSSNKLPIEQSDFSAATEHRVDAKKPEQNGFINKAVECQESNPDATKRFEARKTYPGHRPKLSSKTFTVVEHHKADSLPDQEWVSVKRQCMHCLEPACNAACPVGALHQTPEGAVIYEPGKCIGCRYCMLACPFSVPTYDWDKQIPYVKKCTFCHEAINEATGKDKLNMPACVHACPTGTLQFGERKTLVDEAWRRRKDVAKYVEHTFGEKEVGGTGWLYISPVPFKELGFPVNLGIKAYPEYTAATLDYVPMGVTGSGLVMAGLYWLYKRKLELADPTGEITQKGGGD